VLTDDYPLAYIRGSSHLVVVNPRRAPASAALDAIAGTNAHPLEVSGARLQRDGGIEADGFGHAAFALA
jgi:hypothetical protein